MKVRLYENDILTTSISTAQFVGVEVDVPDETAHRWAAAQAAWMYAEREMSEVRDKAERNRPSRRHGLRCPDVFAGVDHPEHWYVVMAGTIVVAQGQCHGFQKQEDKT